jgi:hypothetical protein
MHEWLITRGMVVGAPFEWQMQIYVPWNLSLTHEGPCHQSLQWANNGKVRAFANALRFYPDIKTYLDWLDYLSQAITSAKQAKAWIENNYGDMRNVHSNTALHP